MISTAKTGKLAFIVILITFASKLLGFIREAIIASRFGASNETDAYVIAITVYTIVFVVFWESINNAFIPSYIRIFKNDEKKGSTFASNIILQIFAISIVTVIAGEIFVKFIVQLIAPGLSNNTALLAQNFIRITLPVIIITGISIIVGGILQAKEKFLPQTIMGIPNHIMVIGILAAYGSCIGVKGLVILTAIGTATQVIVQLPFLWQTGFKFIPSIKATTTEYKLFYAAIMPIFISTSARQINIMVDRAFASYTGHGNISILNYASTLNMAVISLFITTVTTVFYPYMADMSQDKYVKNSMLSDYLYKLLIIVLPVAVIVCILKGEIASIIYQRGSFTQQNASSTGSAFMYYSFSIIPYAVTDIINKHFYIHGNTKLPMRVGIISVLTNITFNFILIKPMGIRGLALSTSLSSFITMTIMIIFARRNNFIKIIDLLRKCFPILLGGLIMLVGVILIKTNIGSSTASTGFIKTIILSAGYSIIAMLLYMSTIYIYKKLVR